MTDPYERLVARRPIHRQSAFLLSFMNLLQPDQRYGMFLLWYENNLKRIFPS